MILTTQQAVIMARDIFAARSADPRLTPAHRVRCTDAVAACDLLLTRLRADGTLANNQRASNYETFKEKVLTMNAVDLAHPDFSPPELYNAIDLLDYVAEALRDGRGSFEIVLT
jgi:hypothetical protein